MRSFRAVGAAVSAAMVLLVGSVNGQIGPPPAALLRLPRVSPAAPNAASYDASTSQNNRGWAYPRQIANDDPGFPSLGEAERNPWRPLSHSALQAPPQLAPQTAPSPSDRPDPGAPAHRPSHPVGPEMAAPGAPLGLSTIPHAHGTPYMEDLPYAGVAPSASPFHGGFAPGFINPVHPPFHCLSRWYGRAGALIMMRDDENQHQFSWDTNNEAISLTDSRDANFDVRGGVCVHFGRYFNGGLNAVEAVYWGVDPGGSNTFLPGGGVTVTTADDVVGNLNGILNWDDLTYNGLTADLYVNDAEVHAVFRETEIRNVEIHLLQFGGVVPRNACGDCGLRFHGLAGARYFDFCDELVFGADTVDRQFTYAPEEIFYRIKTDNHLIGFQVGGEAEYTLSGRWSLDIGVKAGLYTNRIEHDSIIGGAAGVAVINNGPNQGQVFNVQNSRNDMAFLGELNFGLQCCLTPLWTARVGYRAAAVSGVALPTEQIYPDLRGIQDVERIDSSGSLILYGGYAGFECNF